MGQLSSSQAPEDALHAALISADSRAASELPGFAAANLNLLKSSKTLLKHKKTRPDKS